MNISLVNPPFLTNLGRFSRPSRSPAITKSGTVYYPILLACAGAVLERDGHNVTLIDGCAYGYDDLKTLGLVLEMSPQIIVLEASTPSIYSDIIFALKVREAIPEVFLVFVGPHASALAEEILRDNDHIDAVARGEYDYTLRELANRIPANGFKGDLRQSLLKSIDGLTFRAGDNVFRNKNRPFIKNLDELPFVTSFYKKHLDIHRYNSSIGYNPLVMIQTGRGCPGKCIYCVYPQQMYGSNYRCRSIDNIVSELDYIAAELPEVRTVGIEDDTFTLEKARVLDFCHTLVKRNYTRRIKWWANTRVDCLDLETMKEMKRAGCYMLVPGFESASPAILKTIRKSITINQSERFADWARKAGLLVHGCFMIGNFGETEDTARATIEFAIKLDPDTAQFFPLMVSPGTKAYEYAKEKGMLTTEDYSKWLTPAGLHNTVINLPGLSSDRIMELCDIARREFYWRPSYFVKKAIRSLSSRDELRRNIMAFRNIFKYLRLKS